MAESGAIQIWNRKHEREETEQVYGDWAMRLVYGNPLGRGIAHGLLSRALVSRAYGAYQNTRASRKKIAPFIEKFAIPMQDFESRDYNSFNDFFIRRFRKDARPVTRAAERMPAFCEARYLAYNSLQANAAVPVKGLWLPVANLVSRQKWREKFYDGPGFVARLAPVDYHRFHFPDDGEFLDQYRVAGRLHSVNPVALASRPQILFTNERQVSILQTTNFGLLAYIEVGALCVGKIVQSHKGRQFTRGEEKGYFLFGASTVIVLGEKRAWHPDQDIVKNTRNGRETLIQLGEGIARAGTGTTRE